MRLKKNSKSLSITVNKQLIQIVRQGSGIFFKSNRTSIFRMKMFIMYLLTKNLIMSQSWYFVNKIFLIYCEKICSSDREKLLKFQAEGQEFSKIQRSLEQFYQTVKGQNNFLVTECFFDLFLEVSQISKNRTIIIQIGKNY